MNEVAWATSPNDRWNLLCLPAKDRYFIYCDESYWGRDAIKQSAIKKQAQKQKRLVRTGIKDMPRRTEDYRGPEGERDRVRERRQKQAPKVGDAAIKAALTEGERVRLHQQLDELIDNYNLPPEVVDKLKIKKISTWSTAIKNTDGEFESHPMFGIQLDADPRKFEPEWPPITRVESVKLKKRERAPTSAARKAVILPDLQIPYHDENAVSVALEVVRDVQPDKVVILGDLLDLESFSRFDNLPLAREYSTSTQEAIIRTHLLLAELRKLCPSAEIVVLEGNHDKRIMQDVYKNNKAAFGLRQANNPEGWPVLSVPFLCSFEDLDVKYVDGYPANRYWINENLQVRHGHKVRSGASTAKAVSDDERTTTIFGHVHRLETQYKTVQTFDGGKTNAAHAIGCLCRIDGSVPSANRGVDAFGKPVTNYENWQQAICVVDYEEGDGSFNVNPVYINTFNGYSAIYNGKKYQASS